MNVLFISNDPRILIATSDVRSRMQAYAKEIESQGGSLHVLSRAEQTAKIVEGALTLHGVRVSRWRRIPVLLKQARHIIQEGKIDVVSSQDPFEHGFIAIRAVRGTSARLHIQVHTDFLSPWFVRTGIFRSPRVAMPILNRFRIRIADYVLPKASGIRVVSERVKESMVVRYGTRICTPQVLPVTVTTEMPPAVPLPEHPFTFALLLVSRLEPEKRIEDVLMAIKRLEVGYPSLGLIIVGEGRERKLLERMSASLGLSKKVIFAGQRSDVRGLMQRAQGFIQASAYEGYGVTLIEAALSGVPIITTDVGIVGEVFVGYEHVLSAPVGDPTNLAAHIAWLIEDPQARKVLAQSAKARALEHLGSLHNSPKDIVDNIQKTLSV